MDSHRKTRKPQKRYPNSEFHLVVDVAERLHTSRQNLYQIIRRGELPYYDLAGKWKIRESDIQEFIEKSRRS